MERLKLLRVFLFSLLLLIRPRMDVLIGEKANIHFFNPSNPCGEFSTLD